MSGLFGKPSMPSQTVVPPPQPKQEDEATTNAANFLKLRRRAAFDQSSTMLTQQPLGAAPTQRKTLLGD